MTDGKSVFKAIAGLRHPVKVKCASCSSRGIQGRHNANNLQKKGPGHRDRSPFFHHICAGIQMPYTLCFPRAVRLSSIEAGFRNLPSRIMAAMMYGL